MEIKNNIGQRFGRLILISSAAPKKSKKMAKVQCDCGATVERDWESIFRGTTRSCGCLRREHSAKYKRWDRNVL